MGKFISPPKHAFELTPIICLVAMPPATEYIMMAWGYCNSGTHFLIMFFSLLLAYSVRVEEKEIKKSTIH